LKLELNIFGSWHILGNEYAAEHHPAIQSFIAQPSFSHRSAIFLASHWYTPDDTTWQPQHVTWSHGHTYTSATTTPQHYDDDDTTTP
jgi:hypothetical protein